MGGIPWQSKGCINCRHRKIKCDQAKPECARCIKRGLKCQGFDNYSQFIGAPSLQQSKRKEERSAIRSCQPTVASRNAPLPTGVSSKPAMRAQMFALFKQQTFPSQKPEMPSVNGYQSFLISSIGNLPQKSQMVDKAVSALTCLYLGKNARDPSVLYHGLQLYNSSMRHMSNLMRRGNFDNELLYATYLFQEIAVVHCPDGLTAWGTHIAGMDALLKQYQTKGQNDPILDAIHRHQHGLSLFITSTRRNLLESEYEYLMEPSNGDPQLEIIQLAATLGKLQALLDTIDDSNPLACQDILYRCYEARECLLRLRADGRLGEDPSESKCDTNYFQPTDTAVPSSELPFGSPYNFSSSEHAVLYMTFWGTSILFQQTIDRARSMVHLHMDTTDPHPRDAPDLTSGVAPARHLLNSCPPDPPVLTPSAMPPAPLSQSAGSLPTLASPVIKLLTPQQR